MEPYHLLEVFLSSCGGPLAVVIVAVLVTVRFHRPLSDLLDRINSVTVGPVTADVSQRIGEALRVANALPASDATSAEAQPHSAFAEDAEGAAQPLRLPDLSQLQEGEANPEARRGVLALAAYNPELAMNRVWFQVQEALTQTVKDHGGPTIPTEGSALFKATCLFGLNAIDHRTLDLIERLDTVMREMESAKNPFSLEPKLALDFALVAQSIFVALGVNVPAA